MALDKELARLKASIDRSLERLLPKEREAPTTIHKAMRYGVLSEGKRLRPILLIESSRACGGREKDAMAAACAVEMVHSYSLIHDDLPSMDDDDFRRGRPSCHKAFGEANAILAGDALLTLAFNIMAGGLKPGKAAPAVKELAEAIGTRGMAGGQALDIEFTGTKDIRLQDKINLLKTAKLFEASTKIGAMIATTNKARIRAMARYGLYFGLAFQTADDIADGEGCAGLVGKSAALASSEEMIRRAKTSLGIFGKKASRLNALADDILDKIR